MTVRLSPPYRARVTEPAGETPLHAPEPPLDRRALRDLAALAIVGLGVALVTVSAWTWNWHLGVAALGVFVIAGGLVLGVDT